MSSVDDCVAGYMKREAKKARWDSTACFAINGEQDEGNCASVYARSQCSSV